MQERTDAPALVIDLGHGPLLRQRDRSSLAVHVTAPGQPVGDVERRIAERTGESVTDLARVAPELLDQAEHGRAAKKCVRSKPTRNGDRDRSNVTK